MQSTQFEGEAPLLQNTGPIEESKELQVQAYDKITLKMEGEFSEPKSQVFCVRFDPEEKYIAAGFTDLTIRIYNLFSGKVSYVLKTSLPIEEDIPVTSLRWRPIGTGLKTQNVLTACYADGSIIHWHVTSGKDLKIIPGKVLHTFRTGLPLYCVDYNAVGDTFAVGGKDPAIGVYDEPTKSLKVTLKEGTRDRIGHTNRVFSVKFDDQQPHTLISGGWDKVVNLWDLRTGQAELQMLGPYICGDAIDIKANKVMTGSYRTQDVIQIFDRRKLEKEATIPWNKTGEEVSGRVYSCKFNRNPVFQHKFILAAGAYHNEVKMFDSSTPDYTILTSIKDTDISPKSNMVAFGGADGSVKVMKIAAKEEKPPLFASDAPSPVAAGDESSNFEDQEMSASQDFD